MKKSLISASSLAAFAAVLVSQVTLVSASTVSGSGPVTSPITYPITYPTPTPAPVNLIANPGCEVNTAGWQAWQGKVSRNTSVARSGVASCQVALTNGQVYTLDDYGLTVANPKKGETYTAQAWVRSDSAVGKRAWISIRQKKNGRFIAYADSPHSFKLSKDWQKITVSATVTEDGVTGLDTLVAQTYADAGNSFQVDDYSLVKSESSNRILSNLLNLVNKVI